MKLTKPKNFPIVIAALNGAPERVLAGAEAGLRLALDGVQGETRKHMRGPRPAKLSEVTGRLIKSVAYSVQRTSRGIVGQIGSNVSYARYHEFGFKGAISVRAHTRQVATSGGQRSVKILRDRSGVEFAKQRESVESAQKRGVTFAGQQVKAHTRNVDYRGKPYIKPALLKLQNYIRETIDKAVTKALQNPT